MGVAGMPMISINKAQAPPLAGGVPSRTRASYVRSLPESCGLLSSTTRSDTLSPLKIESVALGLSLRKLSFPWLHSGTKLLVCICPARRAGRSVKQTVTGFTPRKTSFPSLKLTFFAFCTKRTSTFFSDCLPVAVHVITGLALGAGVGDAARVMNRLVAMVMPANAPHIRMSLFIFMGWFDLSFIGLVS